MKKAEKEGIKDKRKAEEGYENGAQTGQVVGHAEAWTETCQRLVMDNPSII